MPRKGPKRPRQPRADDGSHASPPCLTPGTLIETTGGPRRIETLRKGDMVVTRDHGPQPLLWIGRVDLGAADLSRAPQFRPVRIARGTLGPNRPRCDLVVSPQHRLLVTGWQCELFFGEPEMLVAACHLAGWHGVQIEPAVRGVTYMHLLFGRHELIRAEGVWTESLYTGGLDNLMIPAASRAELRDILAVGGHSTPPVSRPAMRRIEALLLDPLAAATA